MNNISKKNLEELIIKIFQSNQKDFLEWVRRDDTDRVSKLLHKGFNPNYNHLANGG